MPSSVKQVYAVAGGVALLALLGFIFAPHIFAAWVDAQASPPDYGASPYSELDLKPVNLSSTAQTKLGNFGAGGFCLSGSCQSTWAGVVTAGGGGGGSGAPTTATYITQTSDSTLTAEQALSALATGPLKNTTGTGMLSVGSINLATEVAGDLAVSHLNGGTGASATTFWSGNGTWQTPAGGGTLTGPSGTTSYVAKWTTGGSVLGNSLIYDNGTNVGIGTGSTFATDASHSTGYKLQVNGDILANALYDRDDSTKYIDPGSGFSGNLAGSLTVGTTLTAATVNTGNLTVTGTCTGCGGGGNWMLSGSDIYYTAGKVGVGTTAMGAKLTVNNPQTVGKTGSAGDALYAYANSATGAALSAEQGNTSGYAVYASGNAYVTGTAQATDFCTIAGKCLSAALLAPPTIVFSPVSAIIQNGYTSSFSWTVSNATSCTGSNTASDTFTGSQNATSGSFTTKVLAGPATYSYTLSCSGTGGTTVQSTSVQVIAAGSVSYANGSGGWVSIPPGVSVVKFNARGGNGGNGVANTGNGTTALGNGGAGGGGSAFAYYGSSVQVLSIGGGGGGAFGVAGGAGGYTGGSLYGGPGAKTWSGGGDATAGSSNLGGTGGGNNGNGATTGPSRPCGAYNIPAPGGANGAPGTNGDSDCNGMGTVGGYGGGGLAASGNGGSATGWGGAGGGGYAGGGGGGASFFHPNWAPTGGGGGGGGGYSLSGMTGPDGNGDLSLNLSLIGNPSQIYVGSGTGGSGTTGNPGGGGTITMKW